MPSKNPKAKAKNGEMKRAKMIVASNAMTANNTKMGDRSAETDGSSEFKVNETASPMQPSIQSRIQASLATNLSRNVNICELRIVSCVFEFAYD